MTRCRPAAERRVASAAAATLLPSRLLDHFVGGGEQGLGYGQADRLRSLEIDHQHVFGRQPNRQVARLGAAQNAVHVESSTAPHVPKVRSVLEKATILRKS